MRCYLVTGPGAKRYASTNADARATRDTQAELLEFVNGLCAELDEKAGDE